MKTKSPLLFAIPLCFAATSITGHAALVWTVGLDDNGWPAGDGGGPNATFVAEANTNPLPGVPDSPETDRLADDDYYFAGVYSTVISSVESFYGPYSPVGLVGLNEEAAERAFAGSDNFLRYHFNLAADLNPNDLLSVTYDALNFDDPAPTNPANTDLRYGMEVYFNGVLVQQQLIIRPTDLDFDYTTPQFSLASVNAQTGPGFDNIVELRGTSYNTEGGGNWMGVDYVQVDSQVVPEPSSALMILFGAMGSLALRRPRRGGAAE